MAMDQREYIMMLPRWRQVRELSVKPRGYRKDGIDSEGNLYLYRMYIMYVKCTGRYPLTVTSLQMFSARSGRILSGGLCRTTGSAGHLS